ncbi:MAG: cation:proton antiporter [Steroidobacteraceae bacterium]
MFELSLYHWSLVGLGAAIVLAYWLPRFVSGREPATSALMIGFGALLFLAIPGGAAWISPLHSPRTWERVSELCVIVGLFGTALRIDRLVQPRAWQPTVRLLVFTMPLSIGALALLGWQVAGMTFAGALLLGAVLSPTDPVLAADVQVGRPSEGGEHPVRFTLTAEAGLNDGLAFPFVHLALALAVSGVSAQLLGDWLWRDLGYRILVGALSGAAIGALLGRVLFVLPRANVLANTRGGVIALAGVLMAYGATELLEGYGFIAAFVAGLVLRRSESQHEFHARLHDFSESIEHALTAVLLIALGASLPALLPALTWRGALIATLFLLVIRPLAGWLALGGHSFATRREALVVAFYGVRGVGSLYYLAFAGAHADWINEAELWAIVAFTIALSTVLHGFTASRAVEEATGEKASETGSPDAD